MGKKIAIDTYYYKDRAKTVGVIFENWEDSEPLKIVSTWSSSFGPYIPGEFFKRELPCIMDLIQKEVPDIKDYDCIILDGLARLPGSSSEGLGLHLESELEKAFPGFRIDQDPMVIGGPAIMGVAKTKFKGVEEDNGTCKVLRGEAKNPLYTNTTWIKMSSSDAADCLRKMHGQYRIPTLLKILDRETKNDI